MANTSRFESVDVLASNHQSLPETTKFELSDLDQDVTGNHTTPCAVYAFNGDKNTTVNSLRLGLENVLTCFPFVGGELLNEGGRLYMLRRNHEPVKLGVHHLDEDPSFPTYDNLVAQGFPSSFFSESASKLTPPNANLAGFRRDDGCPVAVFQANFIRRGVILTLPLHHNCGDVKSIDHVFGFWAASTRAAIQRSAMPIFTPSMDKSYFNASENLSDAEIKTKRARIRGFTFHPIEKDASQSRNDPPKPPPTNVTMYHFPSARCEELKKLCAPSPDSGVPFVSSYDVVCALAWRCITRARIPYLKPDLTSAKTEFAHPVDSRGRVKAVPDEYFGNGFYLMPTDPLPIAELIGDNGIPQAALAIRKATRYFTPDTIPDLVNVRRGISREKEEEIRWVWHPENVVGTSWMGMRSMREYDFGFGLPVSLRLPVPPFEGVLGVLPANRTANGSDGFDMYVVLEDGCQERLRMDQEFARYSSVIGK